MGIPCLQEVGFGYSPNHPLSGKALCLNLKSQEADQVIFGELREQIKEFELAQFDTRRLQQTIKDLVKSDLLSEDKRTALIELRGNETILMEISDVLNMHLDALDAWSLGDEAVPLEMRRNLNGKYRIYMDEEILQALLLHYIGLSWAVRLKKTFTSFFYSGAWKQSSQQSFDRKARLRARSIFAVRNGGQYRVE